MKKIIIGVLLGFGSLATAQVAIGKTAVSSNSVSLEFGTGNRGMVLPWVDNVASVAGAVNGTMVYDATDNKVKVKYASGWNDLSVDETGTTVDPLTSVNGITLQASLDDKSDAKTSIGASSETPGILVLEDTDKAMVLPKVESPHLNIINPAPGMIVYDTLTKQLAVFNGTVWSFWKEQ